MSPPWQLRYHMQYRNSYGCRFAGGGDMSPPYKSRQIRHDSLCILKITIILPAHWIGINVAPNFFKFCLTSYDMVVK